MLKKQNAESKAQKAQATAALPKTYTIHLDEQSVEILTREIRMFKVRDNIEIKPTVLVAIAAQEGLAARMRAVSHWETLTNQTPIENEKK